MSEHRRCAPISGVIYKQWYRSQNRPHTPSFNVMHLIYIATRPGAVYNPECGFGLWGRLDCMQKAGNIDNLITAMGEVADISKERTMYRTVLSLSGEEAMQKGYDSRKAWQALITRKVSVIAKENDMELKDFRWCASYHHERGHPHVHLLFWDNSHRIREEYMGEERFAIASEKIRGGFNSIIYAEELKQIREKENAAKKELKSLSRNQVQGFAELRFFEDDSEAGEPETPPSIYPRELTEETIRRLSEELERLLYLLPTTGQMKYAYLSRQAKDILNGISDLLLENTDLRKPYEEMLDSVREACAIYGNGAEQTEFELEKKRRQILASMGNDLLRSVKALGWLGRLSEERRQRLREEAHTTLLAIADQVVESKLQDDAFQDKLHRLAALLPEHAMSMKETLKDDRVADGLRELVQKCMEEEELLQETWRTQALFHGGGFSGREEKPDLMDLWDQKDALMEDRARLREWLAIQGRFYRYSAANQKLIAEQRPDERCVMSRSRWWECGRVVEWDANPILIKQPTKEKDEDGKPVFQDVEVLDLSETRQISDPKIPPATPGQLQETVELLEMDSDIPVRYATEPEEMGYLRKRRVILLPRDLPVEERFHALIMAQIDARLEDMTITDPESRALVRTGAAIALCARYGADSSRYDISELSAGGERSDQLLHSIQHAVGERPARINWNKLTQQPHSLVENTALLKGYFQMKGRIGRKEIPVLSTDREIRIATARLEGALCVPVEISSDAPAGGSYDPERRVILLRPELEGTERFHALARLGAVAELHQQHGKMGSHTEAAAECMAVSICAGTGIITDRYDLCRASDLTGKASEKLIRELPKLSGEIQKRMDAVQVEQLPEEERAEEAEDAAKQEQQQEQAEREKKEYEEFRAVYRHLHRRLYDEMTQIRGWEFQQQRAGVVSLLMAFCRMSKESNPQQSRDRKFLLHHELSRQARREKAKQLESSSHMWN